MNDKLKCEIRILQTEYLKILISARDNNDTEDTVLVVDEINIFWYKNRKIVRNILNFGFERFSSYIFTAAVTLDTEDKEHFPFLMMGKYHIWDDPICSYYRVIDSTINKAFCDNLKIQIRNTIIDNIKIIEAFGDHIIILPIRYLFEDNDLANKATEQTFQNMFEVPVNFETYFKKMKSIDDIDKCLRKSMKGKIIFYDEDDIKRDFKARFEAFKADYPEIIGDETNDVRIFWMCVYGYLHQTFSILDISLRFQLVPYIRSRVTISYIHALYQNFIDQENDDISEIVFRTTISYIIHNSINKNKMENIELDDFLRLVRESKFEENLMKNVDTELLTKSGEINRSARLIDELIEKIFEVAS